jgi:hypothetical protein
MPEVFDRDNARSSLLLSERSLTAVMRPREVSPANNANPREYRKAGSIRLIRAIRGQFYTLLQSSGTMWKGSKITWKSSKNTG